MKVEIEGDNLGKTSHKTPLMPFLFRIYLLVFICLAVGGSSLLCAGFLQLQQVGAALH